MNIAEAMAEIAAEAERQGFQVRQVRSGSWRFQIGNDNYIVSARTANDLLIALSILIEAGLDWAHWDDPRAYKRAGE